jgi:hypothetical protein
VDICEPMFDGDPSDAIISLVWIMGILLL